MPCRWWTKDGHAEKSAAKRLQRARGKNRTKLSVGHWFLLPRVCCKLVPGRVETTEQLTNEFSRQHSRAVCRTRTSDIAINSGATEATLRMDAICPATQLAHLATLIPEMAHRWLPTLGPRALILRRLYSLGARHRLERSLCTEATLLVYSIGLAAQPPICTLWIPIIRHIRQVLELAHMRSWARDVGEAAITTETALHVLAISITSMHACVASGIPVIMSLGLIIESALCFSRVHRSLGARDTCIREISAETTLLMDSICPAPKLTHFALGVPIVRNVRLVLEAAATGRAWDADEISSAAKATLHMLSVAITTKIAHFARGIPIEAHINGLIIEIALAPRFHIVSGKGIKFAPATCDASR